MEQRCLLCDKDTNNKAHFICKTCLGRKIRFKAKQYGNSGDNLKNYEIRELTLIWALTGKKQVVCNWKKFDGYKSPDICIEKSKLIIEVDGKQHQTDPSQIVSDILRMSHAHRDSYLTIRVPNGVFYSRKDFWRVVHVIRGVAKKLHKKWWQFWK